MKCETCQHFSRGRSGPATCEWMTSRMGCRLCRSVSDLKDWTFAGTGRIRCPLCRMIQRQLPDHDSAETAWGFCEGLQLVPLSEGRPENVRKMSGECPDVVREPSRVVRKSADEKSQRGLFDGMD